MFSKLKSLLQKPANNELPSEEFKHPDTHNGDASECPFMQKSKQNTQSKTKTAKQNTRDSDSESEVEEQPRGGCPFMGGSEAKKNPNLALQHQGYDQPFVSKFKYYLSANKINFDAVRKGRVEAPMLREKFDKYPIYLKHTLFYNGEDFKKVRTFECCSRFMAYEELRERGNKHFRKGKYMKALEFYERAFSLFRWLQHREPQTESQLNLEEPISQSEISEYSENASMSKIPIKVDDLDTSFMKEGKQSQLEKLKQKYQEFFTTYHDDNTIYCNGEEMTQKVDIDMRKSLLIQVYLNMAAVYMQLNHFSLARDIINDAFELSDQVSQVYLRKAQITLCDRSSSTQEMREALSAITRAVQMQPHEKIFQNTNPNILKMVNIHDAKEVYADVKQKIEQRLVEMEASQKQFADTVAKRLVQIHNIEQDIIREGKTPRQNVSELLTESKEWKILMRIHEKYVRIMEFFLEAKDKSQLGLAKKQFQEVLRVEAEIKAIEEIDIDTSDPGYGENQQKIRNRVKNIKRQKCDQIFNSAQYNFQVLEWAIKEIVNEEKQQREQKKKQQQQQAKLRTGETVQQKSSLLSRLPYAMLLLPIVGIALNYLI